MQHSLNDHIANSIRQDNLYKLTNLIAGLIITSFNLVGKLRKSQSLSVKHAQADSVSV